jgi:stage IV sporulation protein FB
MPIVSPSLPGLRLRLFGFPVTIGVDFLLITLIIGLQARPGTAILEWVVVVAVSILIHELGHAFAYGAYNIHPEIRLWGMGGLTLSDFVLPPRKAILVSLAGPLVGIPVALFVMVVKPWLPTDQSLLNYTISDLIFVNLWWGILNLLPIGGLDGGNIVSNLFVVVFGQKGKRPGLILVALASIAIAIGAIFIGFVYLTIVIAFFAILNPEPYLTFWYAVTGGPGRPHLAGSGSDRGGWGRNGMESRPPAREERKEKRGRDRPIVLVAAESRRSFGEVYAETLPVAGPGAAVGAAGALGAPAAALDLDELERRPAPLLADVVGLIARRDDPAVAARLGAEDDPLAVLGIVTRVVEGKRVSQLLATLRRESMPDRTAALLKLQVGLHALGLFGDSMATATILGSAGGPRSAVLEARSAARSGDRKRTAAALERVLALGRIALSDDALGDIARLGPDRKVADLLTRLRDSGSGR